MSEFKGSVITIDPFAFFTTVFVSTPVPKLTKPDIFKLAVVASQIYFLSRRRVLIVVSKLVCWLK